MEATTTTNKLRVLKGHSIEAYTNNGRLLAMDVWTKDGRTHGELIDVTDWNMVQIMRWLGY